MIEINVHIYTDGDFILQNSKKILDPECEYYSARKYFETKIQADLFLDEIFVELNNAENEYNQHQGLIEELHNLNKNFDFFGEKVNYLTSAIYMDGNQEIEIKIKEHNKSKDEWLFQRLNDIKEEYFDMYGTYPNI